MSGSRPADFTPQQLADWQSAQKLALWPSTVTVDGFLRQAGPALTEEPSPAAEGDALILGQKLLDSLDTATPSEIVTAVTALMDSVRDR